MGKSLEVSINVDHEYLEYQLPSLTLQVLVENAVKHNAMAKDSP
jgi:sensor histidine kinase YesM